MAGIVAISAGEPGMRVERIAETGPWLPQAFYRASNTINRWIERSVVRGAVRAFESGDKSKFAAYMQRGRNLYERYTAPTKLQMSMALADLDAKTDAGMQCDLLTHPQHNTQTLLAYVHGGSFIAARSPRLTAMIARIAKAARMNALLIDYRLAPEHPCPAAVDDVVTAIKSVIAKGLHSNHIGLVAESAGAAIALAATLRLRDEGINLGAMCFLSPWTDLALTGKSAAARSITGESPISMESMAICAHLYLQGRSPLDPVASPVYGNLAKLSPMLIHTSSTDALHDDALMLSKKVYEAGNDVTLRIWSRGGHVFEQLFNQKSEDAIRDTAVFLQSHLAPQSRHSN